MILKIKVMALSVAFLWALSACSAAEKHRQADFDANVSGAARADGSGNQVDTVPPVEELAAIQTETEDAMGATIGRDISDTWARKMMEHQKGAIRFAELLLKRSAQPTLRKFAGMMSAQARQNIRVLGSLTETSVLGSESLQELFGRPEVDMYGAMTVPENDTFDHIWVAKMIAFHRGAVRLAGIAINQGDNGRGKEIARQLAAQQANQAQLLSQFSPNLTSYRVQSGGHVKSNDFPERSADVGLNG